MFRYEDRIGDKFEEISRWQHWVRNDLMMSGISTPGEESSLLFATEAVELVSGVLGASEDDPDGLRTRLIQALILHSCWIRDVELGKKAYVQNSTKTSLPVVYATEITATGPSGKFSVDCSDGCSYQISLPNADRETALATQAIGLELARTIGIPVPPLSAVLLEYRLAAQIGLRAKPIAGLAAKAIACAGTRSVSHGRAGLADRPKLPLSLRTTRLLAGITVLNVLTLNPLPEVPALREVNNHAEPFFRNFSHCFFDSDWDRFLAARKNEVVPMPFSSKVKAYEQIEPWVRRVEHIDWERICELTTKFPPEWYGSRPLRVAAIVEKLRERSLILRECILLSLQRKGAATVQSDYDFRGFGTC